MLIKIREDCQDFVGYWACLSWRQPAQRWVECVSDLRILDPRGPMHSVLEDSGSRKHNRCGFGSPNSQAEGHMGMFREACPPEPACSLRVRGLT